MILIALLAMFGLPAPTSADVETARMRIRDQEKARIELVARLSPSVVCLFAGEDHAGGGSGVIIDEKGHGLTNFHVVAPMLPDRTGEAGLANGKLLPIEVLGTDPGGDLAMFRIVGNGPFQPAVLGDSRPLQVGQYALALGNPFGLAEDYTPSVTLGIIAGLHRYQAGVRKALVYSDCIQIDTSINPGNSGGPLFDLDGRLIGINGRVAIEERGRVNVGVGFAIPIDQIKRFIPALRGGLHPSRADAGFTVVDDAGHVRVAKLKQGGAADAAGLRVDDELIEFGGEKIDTADRFTSVIGSYPGHWPIEVSFRRGEKQRRTTLRCGIAELPDFFQQPPGEKPRNDPFGPHAITKAAQRRAIDRALDALRARVPTEGSTRSIKMNNWRKTAAAPTASSGFTITIGDPCGPIREHGTDAVMGTLVGKLLLEKVIGDGFSIIGGDEVRGRIGVVIAGSAEQTPFRFSVDDETGDLLRIEFKDDVTGSEVTYEFADVRKVEGLWWPHKTWLYLDGILFSQDELESLTVPGKSK